MQESTHEVPQSTSLTVLSNELLTLQAIRRTSHGASRLLDAMFAWSVKSRPAPSRIRRDANVYGHMTTGMHDNECTKIRARNKYLGTSSKQKARQRHDLIALANTVCTSRKSCQTCISGSFFHFVKLIFGTMCHTLEKMFLPEDLPVQPNVSPCLLKQEACAISHCPSAQRTPTLWLDSSNIKTREQKCIIGPKTVCSSMNIVLCGRLWVQRQKITVSTVIIWSEHMDCCKYHSPHDYPLKIKQMVFAEAVRHGFEPHDAHDTLLDACDDVIVYCTAPYATGKEHHQQVARKWAENLWVSLRQFVAADDQKGEGFDV